MKPKLVRDRKVIKVPRVARSVGDALHKAEVESKTDKWERCIVLGDSKGKWRMLPTPMKKETALAMLMRAAIDLIMDDLR